MVNGNFKTLREIVVDGVNNVLSMFSLESHCSEVEGVESAMIFLSQCMCVNKHCYKYHNQNVQEKILEEEISL